MKLKEGFITHESMSEHITVTAGNTDFNGMVRSNQTAGFIIECLKNDVTCNEIVAKMLEKLGVLKDMQPKNQLELDLF